VVRTEDVSFPERVSEQVIVLRHWWVRGRSDREANAGGSREG